MIVHDSDENKQRFADAQMRLLGDAVDEFFSFVVAIHMEYWNTGTENINIHVGLSDCSDLENLNNICETYDVDAEGDDFFVCTYDDDGHKKMTPLRQWWARCNTPDMVEELGAFEFLADDNEEGDEA